MPLELVTAFRSVKKILLCGFVYTLLVLTDIWKQKPSGRTMALGSTQPVKEMSTRSISWG